MNLQPLNILLFQIPSIYYLFKLKCTKSNMFAGIMLVLCMVLLLLTTIDDVFQNEILMYTLLGYSISFYVVLLVWILLVFRHILVAHGVMLKKLNWNFAFIPILATCLVGHTYLLYYYIAITLLFLVLDGIKDTAHYYFGDLEAKKLVQSTRVSKLYVLLVYGISNYIFQSNYYVEYRQYGLYILNGALLPGLIIYIHHMLTLAPVTESIQLDDHTDQ